MTRPNSSPPPPPPPAEEQQPTRLLKSLLTGRVYAVTRYTEPETDGDPLVAVEKHDVTGDYRALADAEHAARGLLEDPLGQQAPGHEFDEDQLRRVVREAVDRGAHSDTIDDPVSGGA